jgi:ABC-2 type transport system permease protein
VRAESVDLAVAEGRLLTGPDAGERQLALVQSASRSVSSAERLRSEGLSPAQARRALDPPALAVRQVVRDDDGSAALAFIGMLMLYIAIVTYGYYVASGVVAEKSSRVVEIVVSTIRPAHLLAGKVLGIGLIGLAQLAVVAGGGLAVAVGWGEVDLPARPRRRSSW